MCAEKILSISVVIPTRHRHESLVRLLESLAQQPYPLTEILIVDSSDILPDEAAYKALIPHVPLSLVHSRPSVCIQRNKGVSIAKGDYIFLCDDDIQVTEAYIPDIAKYFLEHPDAGSVAGLFLEKNKDGKWIAERPKKTFKSLLWCYIFQTSVWGNLHNIETNSWIKRHIKKYYDSRKNTYSLAGWPVNTNFEPPVFTTSIYSLGASITKKEWLINAPYEEVLDPYGIGDNYGVSLQFPQQPGIHILTYASIYHHKTPVNRLPFYVSYYRRVLALHYFMKTNSRFSIGNRLWLLWSLVGNTLMFLLKGNFPYLKATLKIIALILLGRNPYLKAKRNNEEVFVPEL